MTKVLCLLIALTHVHLARGLAQKPEPFTDGNGALGRLAGRPFEMKFTALDGRLVDSAKLGGKVILVDCWATWCRPCITEIPRLKALYETFHDSGFEIIGISFDENRERLESFLKTHELAWPQYFDGKGWSNAFSRQFGIVAIPSMLLIDQYGNIVALETRGDLEMKVQSLLLRDRPGKTALGDYKNVAFIDDEAFGRAVASRSMVVLDARPRLFYRLGHVPGALSLPRDEFDAHFAQFQKLLEQRRSEQLHVYCQGTDCEDAKLVAAKLKAKGFHNVVVYREGWDGWLRAQRPVEK